MACYYPLNGWRARSYNTVLGPDGKTFVSNGKRSITFSKANGYTDQPLSVPCGSCTGCMLARATNWAVRGSHELATTDEAIFLTLTYDDEHLPKPALVSVDEMQRFIKRLRKHIAQENRTKTKQLGYYKNRSLRYLICGEYGAKTMRPHYHLILFGWRPDDAKKEVTRNGTPIFTSNAIRSRWGLGNHEFGSVTQASIGYTARYTVKKIFDRGSAGAEFLLSSRSPALGITWLSKHYNEIYPADKVHIAGKSYQPPTTYDRWLEKNNPPLYKEVIRKRVELATTETAKEENTVRRLIIREGVLHNRLKGLQRGL